MTRRLSDRHLDMLWAARENVALASRMGCPLCEDYDTWHDRNRGISPKEHELLNKSLHLIESALGYIPDHIRKIERKARKEWLEDCE